LALRFEGILGQLVKKLKSFRLELEKENVHRAWGSRPQREFGEVRKDQCQE
jgi:hypothetical protein